MASDNRVEHKEGQPVALLVNHHETQQQSLADMMTKAGWTFTLVTDQLAFEHSLSEQEYTVVIAREDCFGLAAEELVRLIQQVSPDQAVIVIGEQVSQGSTAGGVCDPSPSVRFLSEPVSEEALGEVLSVLHDDGRPSFALSDLPKDYSEAYSLTAAELDANPITPQIFQELRRLEHDSDSTVRRMELAFQEALANAFEHGNLELESCWREEIWADGVDKFSKVKEQRLRDLTYAERRLEIFLSIADGSLVIEIQDEGPGFDVESKFDVQDDGSLKCHGRGLKLMFLVMDKVQYSDGGRRIRLEKQLVNAT